MAQQNELFKHMTALFRTYGIGLGGTEHVNQVRNNCASIDGVIKSHVADAVVTASETMIKNMFAEIDRRFKELQALQTTKPTQEAPAVEEKPIEKVVMIPDNDEKMN